MSRTLSLFLLCLGIFFLCGTSAESSRENEGASEKSLLIGLLPEQHIFDQIQRYTPVADYLSSKTGLKIRLKVVTRYGNIVDDFVSLGLDGAFLGSFTYALAHMKLGVEVLARPEGEGLNGSSTYHGLIFVRKDSGIRNVKDMKGKRFAFVDKATTAGFLLPLWYFENGGVRDYKTYFRETYFTGTHKDTIYDVLNGKADAGAAKNTIFNRLSAMDPKIRQQLMILTRSPDVPENGLAVRRTLEPAVTRALLDALLNMHNDPRGATVLRNFGATRFIRTTNEDYESVFRYAREINLNLARYDYMNDR